jgi:hypothetical protein
MRGLASGVFGFGLVRRARCKPRVQCLLGVWCIVQLFCPVLVWLSVRSFGFFISGSLLSPRFSA